MTNPAGPEPIGDILTRLFTSRGWTRRLERQRLESLWTDICPESYRSDSRVLSLKRGILEIEVRSTVLMQELAQFHERSLLAKLQTKLANPKLKKIKFRLGIW